MSPTAVTSRRRASWRTGQSSTAMKFVAGMRGGDLERSFVALDVEQAEAARCSLVSRYGPSLMTGISSRTRTVCVCSTSPRP